MNTESEKRARGPASRDKKPVILAVIGLLAVLGAAGAWRYRHKFRRPLPTLPVAATKNFELGYNLDFPGDWTNLPPFIDHFKNGRGWRGMCRPKPCDPTAHLKLDEHGWVKALTFRDDPSQSYASVEVILNTSPHRSDLGQPFVVTWAGTGQITVDDNEPLDSPRGDHRHEFVMKGDFSVLRIYRSDPQHTGDYVRDIKVFRAEHEQKVANGQLFNPDLLDFLRPFKSLRFMDWMASNEFGVCSGGTQLGKACYVGAQNPCGAGVCTLPGRWSERPQPDQALLLHSAQFLEPLDPSKGPRAGGYPLEVLIALANELQANPHFNLPALYDDDYVEKWGKKVRDTLSPALVATVEYSNEVWNDQFPQAEYVHEEAEKLWPGEETGPVQFMAARTDQMCRILRKVFAGEERRLRCVMSPQTGWRERVDAVLDCPLWVASHPGQKSCVEAVDAINLSGYFSGCLHSSPKVIESWLENGEKYALDKAFEQLEHGGLIEDCTGDGVDNLDHTVETYQFFAQVAVRRGLGLTVYEGGTHFEMGDEPSASRDFLVKMTRDQRMGGAYLRNFSGAVAAGVQRFNSWGWVAPNDTWANAESAVDRNHTKYRAMLEFQKRHSAP